MIIAKNSYSYFGCVSHFRISYWIPEVVWFLSLISDLVGKLVELPFLFLFFFFPRSRECEQASSHFLMHFLNACSDSARVVPGWCQKPRTPSRSLAGIYLGDCCLPPKAYISRQLEWGTRVSGGLRRHKQFSNSPKCPPLSVKECIE